MDQEVNFKTFMSEKHRVYRLLRAGSSMVQHYKTLAKELAGYRGGIVLPEQLLALQGGTVYVVTTSSQTKNSVAVGLISYEKSNLLCKGIRLTRIEEIIDAEQNFDGREGDCFHVEIKDKSTISFAFSTSDHSSPYSQSTLENKERYWFTNRRDATNFAKSRLVIG